MLAQAYQTKPNYKLIAQATPLRSNGHIYAGSIWPWPADGAHLIYAIRRKSDFTKWLGGTGSEQ